MSAIITETLLKYLSGLIDSDGTVAFDFRNRNRNDGWSNLALVVGIASSDEVDKHRFVESLPTLTGHGTTSRNGDKNQYVYWKVTSRRDLEMLVPRLVKHMVVKGRHLQRMFDKWRELRGQQISEEQREELLKFSKDSRCDSGPVKAKNHPSWAWVAGYTDGNGHFQFSLVNGGRKTKDGRETRSMRVDACCHVGDAAVLEFLQKAFGGEIRTHPATENAMIWHRNLGVSQRSFALAFLGKLVNHSRFKKHRIEQMIAFHRQQRPSEKTPEGDATV